MSNKSLPGNDVDGTEETLDLLDTEAEGVIGQTWSYGPNGPVWTNDVISADWYSNPRDAVNAAGPNGTVRFSPGVTYDYGDPIEVQSYQHFIMYGATLRPTGEAGFQTKSLSSRVEGVKLDGGILACRLQAPIGIDFRGFVDSEITNMRIRSFRSFGVWFGGDNDVGGWSNVIRNCRVHDTAGDTSYPGHPEAAMLYFQGKTAGGTGAINANNITVDHCVIQTHAAIGIYMKEGQANTTISNDLGYVAGSSTPGFWGIKYGVDGDYNVSIRDRFEFAGGAISIMGARENMFIGTAITAFAPAYNGWTIEVTNGAYNQFYPSLVHNNGKASWARFNGGEGNVGVFRGQTLLSAAGSPAARYAIGIDSYPRFQHSTSGVMQWGTGALAPDVRLERSTTSRLRLATGSTFQIQGGGWDNGCFMLGGNYLWVDSSGDLRIKSGSAPTSDNDGVVVGSQS